MESTTQRQVPQSKPITDEQLNQCMEFCTMFNVLYAMHKFPIPLRNIDTKKAKSSKMINNKNQRVHKSQYAPKRQPPKGQAPYAKEQVSKTQIKKSTKFQNPTKPIKKQPNYPISPSNYEASQVDNYQYQSEQVQQDASRNFNKKPKPNMKDHFNNKKLRHEQMQQDDGPRQQINLAALISGLAVGKNNTNKSSEFQQRPQYEKASAFGTKTNRLRDEEDDIYTQSRLYQQDYPQTPKNLSYNHQNYYTNTGTNNLYESNYPSSYQNNAKYQNPYASTNSLTPNSSPFISHQPPVSPYANQIRSFNSISPFDTSPNIAKNLFNPLMGNQQSGNFNQPSSAFNQPFDPFGYENAFNQNQSKINHFPKDPSSKSQIRPSQSKIYETPSSASHIRSAKMEFQDDTNNTSPYNQSYARTNQQMFVGQKTPPKTLNPSNTQRSLSPLGNSASCRNFFIQTQKQISVDRSGVSRSKSRRKQRPGGSKSFYQPSMSGRKVVSRQRVENERDYEKVEAYLQQREAEEVDAQMYNGPSQFNGYNNQQFYQEQVRENKKKAVPPTQYPRNTGQTDFSGVSGWQQVNAVQKSTRSQQVINNKNMDPKRGKQPQMNQKQSQRDSPRLGHEIMGNKGKNGLKQDDYEGENDVDLDDLQEDMERLNTSRRKAPKPITEIDLTNTSNPKVRQKR